LVDSLLWHDPYFLFADFQSYVECQAHVSEIYQDRERWTLMSILNAARSGKFSSDRTIREYSRDIWQAKRVTVPLIDEGQVKAGFLQ
jgi:starch phosphorylase